MKGGVCSNIPNKIKTEIGKYVKGDYRFLFLWRLLELFLCFILFGFILVYFVFLCWLMWKGIIKINFLNTMKG